MVDWENRELPVRTQAELLSLNRTGLYYQPLPPSAQAVACKHRIDEIYTAHCYYGYLRIAAQLQREGQPINQKTVARSMQEMGLAAVYLSGVGFFCLCLVASFSLDLRGSGPDKGNEPSCWEASSLQQSNCNEHYTPRKTTHLARLLAAFVAETSTMGRGQVC